MKNQRILDEIAQERITRLLAAAKQRTLSMGRADELSAKYVKIAKGIKDHYGMRQMNPMLKEVLCKTCGMVMVSGLNSKVRLASANGHRVLTCSRCGTQKRFFYR